MFRLSREHADEMIAHAKEDAPNECCGILGGIGEEVKQVYRTRNSEASPVKYRIDSKDQFRVQKELESKGWDYVGLYHSHTFSEAYPSPTDVSLATYVDEESGKKRSAWPGMLYFLVSLRNPESPEVRGFHIEDGEIREEDVVIGG